MLSHECDPSSPSSCADGVLSKSPARLWCRTPVTHRSALSRVALSRPSGTNWVLGAEGRRFRQLSQGAGEDGEGGTGTGVQNGATRSQALPSSYKHSGKSQRDPSSEFPGPEDGPDTPGSPEGNTEGEDGGVSGVSSSCGARGGFLPRHDEDLRAEPAGKPHVIMHARMRAKLLPSCLLPPPAVATDSP